MLMLTSSSISAFALRAFRIEQPNKAVPNKKTKYYKKEIIKNMKEKRF